MRVFTVHETKSNQVGTFRRRVLGMENSGVVLLVSPCIKPECPDLGFMKIPAVELKRSRFKDEKPLADLDTDCYAQLEKMFVFKVLPETDSEFSKQWFTEIARVTELSRYQSLFSDLTSKSPDE